MNNRAKRMANPIAWFAGVIILAASLLAGPGLAFATEANTSGAYAIGIQAEQSDTADDTATDAAQGLTADDNANGFLALGDTTYLWTATVTTPEQTYTGQELTPMPTVELDGEYLEPGVDFVVTYRNNIDAGIATVRVSGIGSYRGMAVGVFTINPKSLAEATVEGVEPATYTGEEITQTPTVTLDGTTLVQEVDYELAYMNNVDAGVASMAIIGIGNYTSMKAAEFTIEPASLEMATVTVADQVYTGEALEPPVTVVLGEKELTQDVDYALTYSDNLNAGTASVLVEGLGNYAGSLTASFEIVQAPMSEAVLTLSKSSLAYTGKVNVPTLTVTYGDMTLVAGTDYEAFYSDVPIEVGAYAVRVKGVGNFTGLESADFKIVPERAKVKSFDVNGKGWLEVKWAEPIAECTGYTVSVVGMKSWDFEESSSTKSYRKAFKNRTFAIGVPAVNTTYKAKVRAYKYVDGQKVYVTKWSKVKKVTV